MMGKVLLDAENGLNRAFEEYQAHQSGLKHDFDALVLQVCIFQYDICVEWIGVLANRSMGFASQVALKGLVLRLFEYLKWLDESDTKLLEEFAFARDMAVSEQLAKIKKKWRAEVKAIRAWADVRNYAAGHYSMNFPAQIDALNSLQLDQVRDTYESFIRFNIEVLGVLVDVGRGNSSDVTSPCCN